MRLPLLPLTAAVSALAVVANGAAVAGDAVGQPQETRLGNEIRSDMKAQQSREAQRQRALDLREQALKAAQARMKRQLDEGQAATAPADGAGGAAGGDNPSEQRFADLARIYQAMKPAKAALVLEKLDPDVQLRIAQHMRERNAGLIMAAMTPQGAAALSMGLARGIPVRAEPMKKAVD
ncbi:MAG: hypothetical protein CMN72_02520 [Sphingomonas sp.]|nr:hypothetical protein [Sphingomonas sp.]